MLRDLKTKNDGGSTGGVHQHQMCAKISARILMSRCETAASEAMQKECTSRRPRSMLQEMRSSSQRSASLEPRNEPDVRREALPRAGPAAPPVRAGKGRRREAALSLPLSRAPRLLVPWARSRNLLSLATPGQVVLEHFFKSYDICLLHHVFKVRVSNFYTTPNSTDLLTVLYFSRAQLLVLFVKLCLLP